MLHFLMDLMVQLILPVLMDQELCKEQMMMMYIRAMGQDSNAQPRDSFKIENNIIAGITGIK